MTLLAIGDGGNGAAFDDEVCSDVLSCAVLVVLFSEVLLSVWTELVLQHMSCVRVLGLRLLFDFRVRESIEYSELQSARLFLWSLFLWTGLRMVVLVQVIWSLFIGIDFNMCKRKEKRITTQGVRTHPT